MNGAECTYAGWSTKLAVCPTQNTLENNGEPTGHILSINIISYRPCLCLSNRPPERWEVLVSIIQAKLNGK